MSTKSKRRTRRRYRIHRKPSEAQVQRVLRAQKALGKALALAPSGSLPNTSRVREGWKRLHRIEKKYRGE